MKGEKIINIIWIGMPVIMLAAVIVSIICGQETTSIWNLAMWVFAVIFVQTMVLSRDKYIHRLKDRLENYDKLTETYKKITTELESRANEANSKLQNYIAGGKMEIWNIIIQSFDKTGEEEQYSIDSFVTESLVRDKYHTWLEEDKANPDFNVEETPGVLEYWYTKKSGEMTRVKVVKSYVFESLE